MYKDDLSDLMTESTYMGRIKKIETKATKRAKKQFFRENPSLSRRLKEKGIGKKEAVKHLRKWKQLLDEKGIKSSYSMVGGKLSSGIKAKTRSTVYKKFGKLKKDELNKPGLSEETQRALNLRRRLEEIQEMDAASGAKAEALDSRKTAVVSISQKKNEKPTASISQQVKKGSSDPIKTQSLKMPKPVEPEVKDMFGPN